MLIHNKTYSITLNIIIFFSLLINLTLFTDPAVIKLNETMYDIPEEESCSLQQWKNPAQDTCQCCLLYKKDKLIDENSADIIIKGCIESNACSEDIIETIKKAYKDENISSENFIAKLYDNSIVIRTMNIDKSLIGPNGNLTEESLPVFLTQAYNEKKLLNEDFSKQECLKVKNLGTQGGNNTLQLFLVTSTCKPSQASMYIIKEASEGLSEMKRLSCLEDIPGMKDLLAPNVPKDLPSIALPFFYFSYPESNQIHYLATMPSAKGKVLSSLVTEFRDNQSPQNAERLKRAFRILGKETANFHKKFAKTTSGPKLGTTITQGDFHFYNIFFDELGGHFTWIDNDGMERSIKTPTSPAADLTKLVYIPFGNHGNYLAFGDLIKNIDLNQWFAISFKPFIEGYIGTYKSTEQLQVLEKLKTIFNHPFLNYWNEIPAFPDVKENYPMYVTWSDFDRDRIKNIQENYINPIIDELIATQTVKT